jgi:hypothetical protein
MFPRRVSNVSKGKHLTFPREVSNVSEEKLCNIFKGKNPMFQRGRF